MRVKPSLVVLAGLFLWSSCGDDDSDTCADGTASIDGRCADAGPDGEVPDAAPVDSGDGLTCGDGTKEVDGKCVAIDEPAPKPIGAPCTVGTDCQTGTCAPAADNLPGGYCTILGCSMANPCPTGSTCYALNKSLSLCMAYCDRGTECRDDENYHCQPLYTTALNICAPSCELTKSCSAGTRCNADSGLCELAECDVASPGNACTAEETCWPDAKGLSSKSGLCLHLCDPGEPEKSCRVGTNEVCQPLAADPEDSGFCAPPVCSSTAECPAGAECANNVCQPPALCEGNDDCADDRTCVSGKCMPKCPGDSKQCSDVHPDLVCASVLAVPACLPLGTFPGSACRASRNEGDRCSSVKVGDGSAAMVCEDDTCLVDCSEGGQALCGGLSDSLQCAKGIFDKDLCLPKGSFPGGDCGPSNTCAQDLNGNPAVDMACVNGSCVIGCAESGKWSGYGDALCSIVDPTLTCATEAGAICVRSCGSDGACDSGFSCLDPGAVPVHANACLPTGSFPGSACRPSSGDACDSDVGGNAAVDMVCSNDVCVVSCPSNDDALCTTVNSALTCAESAGNLCVFGCVAGACPTGYACLDPGDSTHQNACLPIGSFPGSACRSTTGDECDQNLGGNAAVDMACVAGSCVVTCQGNNDVLCGAVDARLTCAESAGNLCVLGCVAGLCPTGYTCLDPGDATHQNACLPTGSFPGSECRATPGNECDQDVGGNAAVDMTCVEDICVVECPNDNDELCSAVDSRLTCTESGGNLCVFGCVSGACPGDYSCLDPGDSTHQNACLPTGSFPSSPCRTTPGDECDDNLGGVGAIDMSCVNDVCAVECPSDNDALCGLVDPRLTCSESAGNLCVLGCVSGLCPSGYSCLDPGDATHQNACLPNGSFPGSTCATGDVCSPGMQCAGDVCAVSCPGDDEATCTTVSPGLTCAAFAGNICLPACVDGLCPIGSSCVAENACLPTS